MIMINWPLLSQKIDDSDEEDNPNSEMEYMSDENFKFISDNIENILLETIDKFDVKNQIDKERAFLTQRAKQVEADCEELETKVKDVRTCLDKIQIDLYNQFRPDLRMLKGISIMDDYTVSPIIQIRAEITPNLEMQRKSTRLHNSKDELGSPLTKTPIKTEVEIPKDLPINSLLDKPLPQIDSIYYITRKNNSQASWIKARLQQVIPPNTNYNGQVWPATTYRLVELKQQRERLLSGKDVAYMTACKSRLAVGTRVISVFKDSNQLVEAKQPKSDPYYAGIVGEHPVESNKYRYLIFFDIGYSQYVSHSGINLVFEASANVWEDMPADQRPFIKKYLESQDRPMVKLLKHQTVRVEYNAKWWPCAVINVDCSLVQVRFSSLKRTEWIYRGSTRLNPMFREEQAATNRHTGLRGRKIGHNESASVVQYTRNTDFIQNSQSPTENNSSTVRAVARKSTAQPHANAAPNVVPFLPPVNKTPANVTGPTSKIMYFTPRDQQVTKREYRPHECSPACKAYLTHNFTKLRGHNPLSKPLLCGWARMTLKDRGRKEIIYKAPCGRMIRDIGEIHYYLRVTESEMTVDLFDFNHMVRCLAEFSVECTPDPKDLSKGLEQVPIPVINGFNNDMLDFCNYSIKRVPMEGVHMNLNQDFLCGCDCDDDCVDKLKCSCWKLTLEGLKYLGKDIDPISVGYIYRRLQEQVITGIYECNPRCKCGPTCLNRVAQNPMTLKLQVFKTHNRGWGIRCLNDIPQGTFICIYAGTLHTEQMANEDGIQYGDEYFAELDYIETVEKFKQDYEEEAYEEEEETTREKSKSPPPEDDDPDGTPVKPFGIKARRNNYLEDNDFSPGSAAIPKSNADTIRSRLRKRKDEEEKKEEKKEPQVKVKPDPDRNVKAIIESVTDNIDTVTISDDEDEGREVLSFNPKANTDLDDRGLKYISVRELFGPGEKENIYIMDAKNAGNIGRFLNHSCSPNVFVQNVFVDTHDLRFPWVAFFSSQFIRAGTELTWNYNYDIGSVPGRVLYCHCASLECKGRLL
ncbi:histone-lysine N-methyltransferase eggless isoform X2 [Cylas formicarius]|uniref:histone-lysine N-methyltransferase eggless isoform X2 n=1 Tax=Cylas formicarius TaxID=197179 RepID=UPI0029584522|nr:histone-lysine N-methyltransferase eggless isoform X2 [Cylas formicarius]